MSAPYPAIDDRLVGEVLDACDVRSDDGIEAIAAGFRRWLPGGSTAKWNAIDAGGTPPGADPSTAVVARLDGSLDSWSCWAFCSGLGAVLAAVGHDVRIAVEHLRTGGKGALVDYHSVLIVDGALLDPYLGPSAPVAPGEDVIRPDAWAAWVPGPRPDHLGTRGGRTYRYRQLAAHLDPNDVRAFCTISETYSGIDRRRTAHWMRDARLWFVREQDDGAAELLVAEGSSPFASSRRVVRRGRFEDLVATIDDRGANE